MSWNATIWNGLKNFIPAVKEEACNNFYNKSIGFYNCSNIETRQWVGLQVLGLGLGVAAGTAGLCVVYGIYKLFIERKPPPPGLVQGMPLVPNDFGEVKKIQQLIKEGRDLDSRVFKCGRTHLHQAAGKGHELVVNELLRANASVDLKDEQGQIALHRACQKGQIKIAQSLIEKGASKLARDLEGRTPLMLLMESGYTGEIDFLIDGDLNQPNKAGNTPLHIAASTGRLSWIQSLLNAGANASLLDAKGRNALQRLLEDQLPLKMFEKQYFVDCSDTERKERSNEVAEAFARLNPRVQLAVKKTMREIAKKAAPGDPKSALASALKDPFFHVTRKNDRRIYLMGAALLNMPKKQKYLVEREPSVNYPLTKRSKEIVPCANLLLGKIEDWNSAFCSLVQRQYRCRGWKGDRVQEERKTLLEKLLNSPKVNPNQPGPDGIPPIHTALRNSGAKFEIVRMLLKSGKIDLENAVDLKGNTVAHVAAEVGAFEVLEEVVKKGINTLKPNQGGVLPLQKALEGRHESCMRLLLNKMDLQQLQEFLIDGLSLVEYALVFAPRGLREALNEKGICTTKNNYNVLRLERALMALFLKDLKFIVTQSGVNIKEINTLIRELESDVEPKSPSLHYQKLKLGVQHYLDVVNLEGEYQMREPYYRGSEMFPMPFGDYFSLRRGIGELANFDLMPFGLQQVFDKMPKELGKFFKQEQNLSSLGLVCKVTAPASKLPSKISGNFKKKVDCDYRALSYEWPEVKA